MNKIISPQLMDKILKDRKIRQAIVRESHFMFFHIYFADYVKYKTAPFQKELFKLTEDESVKMLVVSAFRGCGKTTILSQSYPIWSILGKQQKKHILLLSRTIPQAKQNLKNIKDVLERNNMLPNDLGPFKEDRGDDWRAGSLVLSRQRARITAASMEQGIRGIKHGPDRPQLVIMDDLEDLNSVNSRELREKTYKWFLGDVLPIGDKDTRFIIAGNILHEDSLLMRLKEKIEGNKMRGVFKSYPLLDNEEKIAWPGKYPTIKEIDELKNAIGDEAAFQREYILNIISDKDQVIKPESICYYEKLPEGNNNFLHTITAIDLAFSEKEKADCTAMVSAKVYVLHDEVCIYVLPNPINDRFSPLQTIETAMYVSKSLGNGSPTPIVIEEMAYQNLFIEELRQKNLPVEEFKLMGRDKHSRLMSIAHMIQSGHVLFPISGAEELIRQVVNFEMELHDDLADALITLISHSIKYNVGPMMTIF